MFDFPRLLGIALVAPLILAIFPSCEDRRASENANGGNRAEEKIEEEILELNEEKERLREEQDELQELIGRLVDENGKLKDSP
ncbi:MAG: hypothetical protein AAF733_13615 [Verrucomicrobiota bacterium]